MKTRISAPLQFRRFSGTEIWRINIGEMFIGTSKADHESIAFSLRHPLVRHRFIKIAK